MREIFREREITNHSYIEIADRLGVAPNTVRHYGKRLEQTGLSYCDIEAMNDGELLAHFQITKGCDPNKQMPNWPEVHKRLTSEKYMTLQVLWEEYRATYNERA